MMDGSLLNLFIFSMPGFFFLKIIGYENKSDYQYFMISTGTGVLIFAFLELVPAEILTIEIENIYAGGAILSALAISAAAGIRIANKFAKMDRHRKPAKKANK